MGRTMEDVHKKPNEGTSMEYVLETCGLTKRFGRSAEAQTAVANVGLHLREGEVYGLLGPNGAGKSTTLKMICGMLRPTEGQILFAATASIPSAASSRRRRSTPPSPPARTSACARRSSACPRAA